MGGSFWEDKWLGEMGFAVHFPDSCVSLNKDITGENVFSNGFRCFLCLNKDITVEKRFFPMVLVA